MFTTCARYRLVQCPTLPRLPGFRPARRPVYPVDAATQPQLLLREPTGSFAACYEGSRRSRVTGACGSSAARLSQGTGAGALRAVLPRTEARALGATTLS